MPSRQIKWKTAAFRVGLRGFCILIDLPPTFSSSAAQVMDSPGALRLPFHSCKA